MPDSLIPYDEIVQDALRAVVAACWGVQSNLDLPGTTISTSPSRPTRRAFRSRSS
jgi:hypothetical protein